MRIRALGVVAVAVWALALGYSVRATPAAAVLQQSGAEPAAAAPAPPTNADCLMCHEDDSAVRADGTKVVVKQAVFEHSVHGALSCVDCHEDLAAAELPHAEDLKPVDCSICHSDAAEQFKQSVHARVAGPAAVSCADCHGAHDIKPKSDPDSRMYHLNIVAMCAKCHTAADALTRTGSPDAAIVGFADSIHGRVLAKSGLMVAPTCTSCHGAHDIRASENPGSRVALGNLAETCGTCHAGVAREFEGGVHAAILETGGSNAPACQTCHTAHTIARSSDPGWQLSVINQCGTCHAERMSTFKDTFHGQVTTLGSRSVAGCADCHGAHGILPASDPRSPIAPSNLIQTCGKCHENANPNFVLYDPHADKHDPERNPALYYTSKFMIGLLVGTFSFFGLHTILWFGREIRVKRERARAGRQGKA